MSMTETSNKIYKPVNYKKSDIRSYLFEIIAINNEKRYIKFQK